MAGWAFVDGEGMPLDRARVPATDPGFTHGYTVFETARSDAVGHIRRVGEHLDRLAASCEATGIAMHDRSVIEDEMHRAGAAVGAPSRIRVTLSGSGLRVVTAEPLDPARIHRPVRAVRGVHRDEPYLGGSVKHGSRGPWIAAVRRSGADEVLLVDGRGRFTEGTTCAILAVIDGVLWTAPHDGRILVSTTCLEVLERAAARGIAVRREGPPASGPWDGLYVASTTRDLAPVCELDGEALPTWDPVGRALADG